MKFAPDKILKVTFVRESLGRDIVPKVYTRFGGVTDVTANTLLQFARDEAMTLEINDFCITIIDHKRRVHLIAEDK